MKVKKELGIWNFKMEEQKDPTTKTPKWNRTEKKQTGNSLREWN